MKLFSFFILFFAAGALIFSVDIPSWAAKQAPKPISTPAPPPVAYYPGGQIEIEVSLTRDDLLPYAVQLADKLTKPSKDEKGEMTTGMAQVLRDVKAAYGLQMAVSGEVDTQQIIGFYTRYPADKNMKRILRAEDENGAISFLWMGGNGVYGFRIYKTDELKPRTRIQVGRIDGPVDFLELVQMKGLERLMPCLTAPKPPVQASSN